MSKNRTFFSCVIPSVLAFALSGVYAIVDGFFIGNSIGDIGLSTINVAYPVVALMQAIGTGIGMGGAVVYSITGASGDQKKADLYAGGTGTFLLIASIVITALSYIFLDTVLALLGGEGDIFILGKKYLHIIIFGTVFQIFSTGVVPLIRNCNGSAFAMISMVPGFLTNILLDYLFVWVFQWGVTGAAAATVIGEGVTMAMGTVYLCMRKIPLFRFHIPGASSLFSRIVKIGLAPFGLTMTPNIALVLMNRRLILYGGEQAVACYACIAYALTIVYMFLQGVGDGSQPLMSKYYGAGEVKEFYGVRRMAYGLAEVLAIFSICVLFMGRFQIGLLFGASKAVLIETGNVISMFLVGVVFLAFTRITTSGFYASENNLFSYILVYAEPVLLFVFLLVLPPIFGLQGVWWSTGLSQVVCGGIAMVFGFLESRKRIPGM